MVIRSTFRVVVGILVIAGALAAAACHRHHTPAERADWMTGKIAKELKLDEQQKAKLAAVRDEVLAARAESKKERRAMMEEVIAQVQSERLDQAKVSQLFEQHQAGQTRMLTRVLPKVAEWHASLRPEQKAEAVEHLRKWIERHEDGE
ncbi:Spy/CpxP family protein refolding chaperone [Nitrospira sp. NS4]|uniref:Spy/CpxP family protein refolding chaperone n=1 Tax=Nitrospira sp. NS4 TaxID=3414498 RepID=UPI003C2DA203